MGDGQPVPEIASRLEGGHVVDRQIEPGGFLAEVANDRDRAIGVKSRFCARFNARSGPRISAVAWLGLGRPGE
jgi:hypothetical protein